MQPVLTQTVQKLFVLGQYQLETPSVDWAALSPLLVMGVVPILFLTLWSLLSDKLPRRTPSIVSVVAGVGTFIAVCCQWKRLNELGEASSVVTLANAYGIDAMALLLTGLIAIAVALVGLFAYDYLEREGIYSAEFFVLMMLSASGGIIMATANDLIVMFLGVEILSIAVYVLAASHLRRIQSQEAGLKYFVLGALASAFLLYGIALMYGATGSTNIAFMGQHADQLENRGLAFGAMAMLLVGLGFKVAAVPFHSWTPDVYEGSPTPVVSFMASAVKVAGFAALIRIFSVALDGFAVDWAPVVAVLAVLSMVIGALVGIVQNNVKRMLAYSSISHAGFILIGLEAATTEGISASLFYLVAYTFLALGSFAAVSVVSGKGDNLTTLSDFSGLAKTDGTLAVLFTILLLAQAGVPFTTGFLGKLAVIKATIDTENYLLGVIAMLSAVVGAFLYLRIVLAMFGDRDADAGEADVQRSGTVAFVVSTCVAFTVVFGIFADPLMNLVNDATAVVGL